jgi:hypothetical protein
VFLPPDEWPNPVAAYLTGSITAEELEKAAAAAAPHEHGPTPNCQVACYTGETSLSLGHDNAKARLLEAKKLCGPHTVEGLLARAELQRIMP